MLLFHTFDLRLREMSELIDTVDGDNAASLGNESLAEMERRHKAETRKLEGEIRALLKTAKKSTKAQIETQIIRMQYELKGRHAEEIEECEARGGAEEATTVPQDTPSQIEDDNEVDVKKTDEEIAAAKRAKSKKKQDKKKTKEQELASVKQQLKDDNSGPSAREIELAKINAKLAQDSVAVKTIISDGNCLYRAIADQLQYTGSSHSEDHQSLRGVAAAYIRNHAEDFSPFIGVEAPSPEFDAYCDKVASLTDAEWGGQLEVKALSAALNVPILIYAADGPVVTMNESESTSAIPLRVTFHKNYYTLGEHYNSVESAGPKDA